MRLHDIITKKLVERKIKLFIVSIFHPPLMEEIQILEPIPLGNLSPLKKTYINEINNKFFDELNQMDLHTTPTMPFITLLESISIHKDTNINALKVKLKKPTIFLQRSCKDIQTNSFGIHARNLWQVNTNVQFILDPYATTSYCTFYSIKIDKTITRELKTITINCNENKIEANTCIKKMGNTFFNVQQMSTQLATYIVLSIPLYHASITFKFINTSPLQECAFVLKDVKSLKALPSNSTNIMCPSIIDKYIKKA